MHEIWKLDIGTLGPSAFLQDLNAEAPPHLGAILTLAHFLDRSLDQRPARQSDAPAWFEAAAALVRNELRTLTASAPKVVCIS